MMNARRILLALLLAIASYCAFAQVGGPLIGQGGASGTANITGGTITGVTITSLAADLAVADGGTAASTARAAAANLAIPFILGKSAVAVSGAADTNENALATITVPAGALGANGQLRIYTLWTVTNSANTKTLRIRYSTITGTQYLSLNVSTIATFADLRIIGNRNATNSQVGYANNQTPSVGTSATAVTTSAVDTTVSTTVVVTCQKATAGEACTLEGYVVELLADGT